ncbi:MAG: hypothetical protein ACTHNU_12440 [Gaiellales bacterium]
MRWKLLAVAVVGLAIAGSIRWWTGRVETGTVSAQLTISNVCAGQDPSAGQLCRQMRAHPLKIVLMNARAEDSPSNEVVVTADHSGAVDARVRPGYYRVAFVVGGSGMITNLGWRTVRVGPGQRLALGRVEPAGDAFHVTAITGLSSQS